VTCGTDGKPCCSGVCGAGSKCATADFCIDVGQACDTRYPSQCCTLNCVDDGTPGDSGICATNLCAVTGTACTANTQCCSGKCGDGTPAGGESNSCTAVTPVGDSCKTLYESCSSGPECCSENCVGGKCVRAYTCNAYDDICYRGEDCCSGLCNTTASFPGRCTKLTGGAAGSCDQGGTPCTGSSNCCSGRCADLGSGVTVCQPSGGCRMTGDYCDANEDCCNINQLVAESQEINCNTYRCDLGGSCNPPGNLCGPKMNDNCCTESPQVKGSSVCKQDSNLIWRCFGGGANPTQCPTGYDGTNPNCCIEMGQICQFKDQCCNLAPCVPDAGGILRCAAPENACMPLGAGCSVNADCCDGRSCKDIVELGKVCADASCNSATCATCKSNGLACTADANCCSGYCDGTGHCAIPTCNATGASCSNGTECCSGLCDGTSHCAAPCKGSGTSCTETADCCTGLSCNIPLGDTSGTCETSTTPSCSESGQACATTSDCCDPTTRLTCQDAAGASCTGTGCTCKPPAPTCGSAMQACTTADPCCSGQNLSCVTRDGGGAQIPCPAATTCACCTTTGGACSTDAQCCDGNWCNNTTGQCATGCRPEGQYCTLDAQCCPLSSDNVPMICDPATFTCKKDNA
jgi:hypothetical protein